MIRPALLAAALALTSAGPVLAQEAAPAAAPAVGEWRAVAPDNLMVIDTTKGRILIELAPLAAPDHVERMRLLARRGFYDGIVWHRVIDWFMAQTGDPLGTGEGQSWYPNLKGEFTFQRTPETPFVPVARPTGSEIGFIGSLPVQTQPDSLLALNGSGRAATWALYCPGVAGMARDDSPDSGNSQFFLMRQAYPSLEKRYTVWGRVVSGLDVVRAIKVGDGDNGAVTSEPDRMVRVRIASDMAEAERPVVQVLDPASATFQALVEAARRARGADFSACDLEFPVQVTGGAAPAA
ncbi:MAG: peptidylprolyl isomerase [Brevundimonas sp.]|uniref:peptidylprolyl isomerase n=1 Tax=Brevundimonas sp. TaxID=1871086 RepID=UPI0025C22D9B|nr:peptidylprolyl isomerase [Brevundimonas sp.]MBX3477834.1 peptidylprolyl isomerase [Brevundimonas sp.]